jgi:hypothetical protein
MQMRHPHPAHVVRKNGWAVGGPLTPHPDEQLDAEIAELPTDLAARRLVVEGDLDGKRC